MIRIALLAVAAVAALLAIPAIRHWREQPAPPPSSVRLSLPFSPDLEAGSGDEPLDAAIAPDESAIVFVATRGGSRQLWHRLLDAEQAEPIAGTSAAQLPAWKQTGNAIAFFADGRLKQITLGDRTVHDLAEGSSPAGATWLRDGSLLFAAGAAGPLRRLRDGRVEAATALAEGDLTHVYPAAVGASDDFVYVAVRENGRRIVRLVAGGRERDLTATSSHAALVGDHLLYVRDGVLLAYQWDPERGTLAAHGVPLGLDVGISAAGRGLFAASPTLLLYAPSAPRRQEIVWLDASGTRLRTIGDAGDHWQVRLSPDDRHAAVATMDPLLGALDVVVLPALAAGAAKRLTLALAAETDPVWSPDAARVLYRSMERGTADLMVKRPDAAAAPAEPMLRSPLDETPTDWAGAEILFHAGERAGTDIFLLQTATATYEPVAATPFNEADGRWSPDRQWMAYVSDESGRPDVYALNRAGMRVRVSFGGGTRPRWTRDGRAIVFTRGSQVMRADLAGREFSPAQLLFDAPGLRDLDLAHRSDRLLALLPIGAAAPPTVSAVLNWAQLARASADASGGRNVTPRRTSRR